MSHGLPEEIHVVKFLSHGKERFIIGKIIRKTDLVKLVDDRGTTLTPRIIDFKNNTMSIDGNDHNIITDQGIIGKLTTVGGENAIKFHFGNVVGIGSREIMLAPSPAVVAAPAPAAPSSLSSSSSPPLLSVVSSSRNSATMADSASTPSTTSTRGATLLFSAGEEEGAEAAEAFPLLLSFP